MYVSWAVVLTNANRRGKSLTLHPLFQVKIDRWLWLWLWLSRKLIPSLLSLITFLIHSHLAVPSLPPLYTASISSPDRLPSSTLSATYCSERLFYLYLPPSKSPLPQNFLIHHITPYSATHSTHTPEYSAAHHAQAAA